MRDLTRDPIDGPFIRGRVQAAHRAIEMLATALNNLVNLTDTTIDEYGDVLNIEGMLEPVLASLNDANDTLLAELEKEAVR